MQIFSILVLLLPSISAFVPSNVARSATSVALFSAADIAEAKADLKTNPKTFFMDVRELNEWAEGHFAGAAPYPLSTLTKGKWMNPKNGVFSPGSFPIDNATGVAILPKKRIYIHSQKGGRAKQAGDLFISMGYKNVVVFEETFEELAAAGISEVVVGEMRPGQAYVRDDAKF